MAPYDTPAPQVSFYDAPKPSYGAPSSSYEGQGFKRSVKQYFLYQFAVKLIFFPLIQFEEEGKTLAELVLKNFEDRELKPQFDFDAFATAMKSAQKQLQ